MAYQPHRYTRTRDLLQDFVQVLSSDIDALLLFDIYSAGEKPIPGISSETLITLIQEQQNTATLKTHLVSPKETFTEKLTSVLQDNDILLMQGAGDIGNIAANLAVNLSHKKFSDELHELT